MNRSILHRWRLEGMAASIHKTFGDHPRRSELARDEPENAAGCQVPRVIVDHHRERARSYSIKSTWHPTADSLQLESQARRAKGWR